MLDNAAYLGEQLVVLPMKAWGVLLGVLLLAGCASPSPDKDDPRVSQGASEPSTTTSASLLDEAVSLTPGGTQTWSVDVPANATKLHLTIQYAENRFFVLGMHLSLDGCGQQDFETTGSIGGGPGTREYPVCETATPGAHDFTLVVDNGILDGQVRLAADVPRV